MSSTSATDGRSLKAIEADFDGLVESQMPIALAREEFERLWDEVNLIAALLIATSSVTPYLALLQRMQEMFETRFADRPRVNGTLTRQR